MAGSAMTKGASKKVKSGAERRKTKYPRQALRTEKNKRTQAKARDRWLTRRIEKLAESAFSRGVSFAINEFIRKRANELGITIKEYKKQNPQWKEIA